MATIHDLPLELLGDILERELKPLDRAKASLVCRSWREPLSERCSAVSHSGGRTSRLATGSHARPELAFAQEAWSLEINLALTPL